MDEGTAEDAPRQALPAALAAQLALADAVTDTDPAAREKALRDAYEQVKGDYAQVCLSAVDRL